MDRGGFQQKTIRLLVKTPNQNHGDQTIEGVDLNWTIKDLKTHLASVYPTRPAVSEQRLIYSGKLLLDHLHIRDIFRQTDSILTLHLVCAVRTPATGPLGARPKVKLTEQPHPQPSTSSSGTSSSPRTQSPVAMPTPSSSPRTQSPMATPTPISSLRTQSPMATPTPSSSSRAQGPIVAPSVPSSTPELRQRRQTSPAPSPPAPSTPAPSGPASAAPAPAAWPATAVPGVPHITPAVFPTYSLYSPQQLLWLQQVYARQYYMQYHAALAAAGTASLAPATTIGPYPPVPAPQAPVPAAIPNQNPIDNLPANQNAAQDAPFINPGAANQNMRMNAQGGPVVEDEDDMDRDWLDWVYTAARFSVFLSIVYFYSSLSRFVFVMSSVILMYLHTAGWFPFRRRPLVPGPNPQQNHENLHNQNPLQAPVEPPAGGEEAEHADIVEGPDGQGPMTAVLVPPHRVSIMWTAWVFFKTFFSSLIPEAPQPVAN